MTANSAQVRPIVAYPSEVESDWNDVSGVLVTLVVDGNRKQIAGVDPSAREDGDASSARTLSLDRRFEFATQRTRDLARRQFELRFQMNGSDARPCAAQHINIDDRIGEYSLGRSEEHTSELQ